MNVDTLLATLILCANIGAAVFSVVSVLSDRRDPEALIASVLPLWAIALTVVVAVGFALAMTTKDLYYTALASVAGVAVYACVAVCLQRYIVARLSQYGYRLS